MALTVRGKSLPHQADGRAPRHGGPPYRMRKRKKILSLVAEKLGKETQKFGKMEKERKKERLKCSLYFDSGTSKGHRHFSCLETTARKVSSPPGTSVSFSLTRSISFLWIHLEPRRQQQRGILLGKKTGCEDSHSEPYSNPILLTRHHLQRIQPPQS